MQDNLKRALQGGAREAGMPAETFRESTLPPLEEQLRRKIEILGLQPYEIDPIRRMLHSFEWGEKELPQGAGQWALIASVSMEWNENPAVLLKLHERIALERPFVTDVTRASRTQRLHRTSSSLGLIRQMQTYLLKLVPVQLGVKWTGYSADEVRGRISRPGDNRSDEFGMDVRVLADIFAMAPEALPAPGTGISACGSSVDRDEVPVYETDEAGQLHCAHHPADEAHPSRGQATCFVFRHKQKA